jgi:hypothetical protein
MKPRIMAFAIIRGFVLNATTILTNTVPGKGYTDIGRHTEKVKYSQ